MDYHDLKAENLSSTEVNLVCSCGWHYTANMQFAQAIGERHMFAAENNHRYPTR